MKFLKTMPGILYIVSTPIGNLKDITLRAIETLKEVDFIACEDTRVTSVLLKHFEIQRDKHSNQGGKELISVNAVNENSRINSVLGKIKKGENCALVSDAGTPGISDPGVRLISQAIREGIQIVPVPGVSAAITALSISGLPTDSFVFEGFLPQKKGRQKKLKELSKEKRTIIIYESTYRIEKLLNELNEYMPDRFIVVCRELTKKFEDIWRGFPGELLNSFDEKVSKGEFVVIISPSQFLPSDKKLIKQL